MNTPPDLISAAVRELILGDYPNVLTLEQVGKILGLSRATVFERARRKELPLLPGDGVQRVGKLALLGHLAGPHAEALYRALFSTPPTEAPHA